MTSSKWSAHGNVYLLVEPADRRLTAVEAAGLSQQHATDGVLEVIATDGAEADVVIWNPDGSRAEMSGNGTRIVARWLSERAGEPNVRVRVGERAVEACVREREVEQDLGEITVGEAEKVAGVEIVPVSVGNPHAVVRGDPDDLPLIGPLLATHPRFPERTNVQIAKVVEPGRVVARVWERGVGETAASGTSAAAVAAATHGEGEVVVSFPGGDLRVRIANGRAHVTGPAERVG